MVFFMETETVFACRVIQNVVSFICNLLEIVGESTRWMHATNKMPGMLRRKRVDQLYSA